MGLEYVLEDENRTLLRETADPKQILDGLLGRAYDERLPLLSGVDLYGDTIFNRQQMARVLEEWKRVLEWATSEDQRALIGEIIGLCQECESTVHTYIRIVGD